jgi:hypothetical protein
MTTAAIVQDEPAQMGLAASKILTIYGYGAHDLPGLSGLAGLIGRLHLRSQPQSISGALGAWQELTQPLGHLALEDLAHAVLSGVVAGVHGNHPVKRSRYCSLDDLKSICVHRLYGPPRRLNAVD